MNQRIWWQYNEKGEAVRWPEGELPNECTVWRASWLNQFIAWKHYIEAFEKPSRATWLDPDAPEWVRPSITNVQDAYFWESLAPKSCRYLYSPKRYVEGFDGHLVGSGESFNPKNNVAPDSRPWVISMVQDVPAGEWDDEKHYYDHIETNPEKVDNFRPAPIFNLKLHTKEKGATIHPGGVRKVRHLPNGKTQILEPDRLREYLLCLRKYYDSLDFKIPSRTAATPSRYFVMRGVHWLAESQGNTQTWKKRKWYASGDFIEVPYEDEDGNPWPIRNTERHICRDENGKLVMVDSNGGHTCYDADGCVVSGLSREDEYKVRTSRGFRIVKRNVDHVCHTVKRDEDGEIESVHTVNWPNGRKGEHYCFDEDGNGIRVAMNDYPRLGIGGNENHRTDEHECHYSDGSAYICEPCGGHICKDEHGNNMYETYTQEVNVPEDGEGNAQQVEYYDQRDRPYAYVGTAIVYDEYGDIPAECTCETVRDIQKKENFPNFTHDECLISMRAGGTGPMGISGADAWKIMKRNPSKEQRFSYGDETCYGFIPRTSIDQSEDIVLFLALAVPDRLPKEWRGPDWPEKMAWYGN